MAVNVPGVIVMVFFYLLVLGVGIWASIKSRREESKTAANKMDMALLGNRGIKKAVGIFTMTATWVGGFFVMGMTEMVYTPSLGLTSAVLLNTATSFSFIFGGLLFSKPMRDRKYVTMLDPFQVKYGKTVLVIQSLTSLLMDVVWLAATLISLGSAMHVILDLSYTVSIWISAAVVIVYTLLGGLYSVAYTDIIQLILIFITLWLCVPFIMLSPASEDISKTAWNYTFQPPWINELEGKFGWTALDTFLYVGLGNLGYQAFHQRILSATSSSSARVTCFVAAFAILIFGIPSILIGAVAASTDWNMTSYGSPSPLERGEAHMILPITLQHLPPMAISIIGTGAIAAAVMSSADSALLSFSSIFTSNIYVTLLRPKASQREIQWVIRAAVIAGGLLGTSLTSLQKSIITLVFFGFEGAYILVFSQLVCALFFNSSNTYGAISGWMVGLVLRLLSGEPSVGLAPVIHFPGCTLEDGIYVQYSPIKTISMLAAFSANLIVSCLVAELFNKGLLPEELDVFKVKAQCSPVPLTPISDTKGCNSKERSDEKEGNQESTEPMINAAC